MSSTKDSRAPLLPRGRIAEWGKEQVEKLSTLELRALLANAERLGEPDLAAMCNEILTARPRGLPPVRRQKLPGEPRRLVARSKAFEMNGITPKNRVWSRGGVRSDGAVVFTLAAEDVQKSETTSECLLWAPNMKGSHPWSDTPGGKERLEHCKTAIERGAAEVLLSYGPQVDGRPVLGVKVEKRGEQYWAVWTPHKRVVVINHP